MVKKDKKRTKSLSAVIISFNEEKKIRRTLKSVQWCDEVILVDGQSTDRTVEIAKPLVTKLISIPNDPSMMSMRNQGILKADSDWVLIVDSDEVIPPCLVKEIRRHIQSDKYVGYRLPRKQCFFGKWMKHSGWYPDYQTRLVKKGYGLYKDMHVHEQLVLDGPIGFIDVPFEHYPYLDRQEYFHKVYRYIRFEAGKLAEKEKPPSAFIYLLIRPPARFLSILFRLKGILDGWRGLVLAFFAAYHEFMSYLYYLHIKNKQSIFPKKHDV